MDYINHFNQQSDNYLLFRPTYPQSLYACLSDLQQNKDCAWDCGTGNGQAAVALSHYFTKVIATDVNPSQLDAAPSQANIEYLCCAAENTPIPTASVDLITIAQALHWFNFDLFYQEVRRVSHPNAVIAAWCYSLGKFNTNLDQVIEKLYLLILGDVYWPAERHYIDDAYLTIPFPFTRIVTPDFVIEKELTFEQLIGYLNTWSAVKEYQVRNQINPVDLITAELQLAWEGARTRIMKWPLHLLAGYVQQ